jgi:F-type H+-transporting ATPase subunit delta
MQNPRLAGRWAKSLIDLAAENKQLENVYKDMVFLQSLCKESRGFANLLKSPVIKPDKKQAVIRAVASEKLSPITAGFIRLLIQKGREHFLPEIINAFIEKYKAVKEIYTVKLTTAIPVSEEVKNAIINTVQSQTRIKNIDLKTEVNEDIIGGFRLEMEDKLIDASIAYDLNKIKAQFMNNDFLYRIR